MNNFKVSIIIPMYNVEQYISKCIMSCVNQTYKNIEIVAVDDGSPDNSGFIADEISNKYDNVNVIHKKNGGVSTARNCGIENSKGDYIVFLDGDDYLNTDFVDYMIGLVNKTNADFCLSENCFTNSEQKQPEDIIKVLSSCEATSLLLDLKIEVGCWNKIFKRELIIKNNIFFPTDLYYGEGLYFITKCAQASKNIGVGKRRVYNYRKNNFSSATTKFKYDKYINGEKSLLRIKEELVNKDSQVENTWIFHYCSFCIVALIDLINNKKSVDNYSQKYRYWYSNIKKVSKNLVFNIKIKFKTRLKIIIVILFPKIMALRFKRFQKKIAKRSV